MADKKDKLGDTSWMAAGGKPDTELEAALKKIQGNADYRVLTKADYESLINLAKKNTTTGSPKLASLLTPPPATLGARPSLAASLGAKPKVLFSTHKYIYSCPKISASSK